VSPQAQAANNTKATATSTSASTTTSPQTATEFWSQFQSVQRNPPALASLLLSVAPAKLTAYLDKQLEADQVQAAVECLTTSSALTESSPWRNLHAIFARLRALSHTSRLDLAWSLVDDDVRRRLTDQVKQLCISVKTLGKDKIDESEVEAVGRAFE